MHRVNFRVALALRKVQFATLECIGVSRIRKKRLYLFGGITAELFQKFRSANAHEPREISLVILRSIKTERTPRIPVPEKAWAFPAQAA